MSTETYDVVVIGGGPSGPLLQMISLAEDGMFCC